MTITELINKLNLLNIDDLETTIDIHLMTQKIDELIKYLEDLSKNNLNKEDVATIQNLSRLLGQTDIEGQISEVEVVNNFLTVQLENASEERRKNEKMYRTLGLVTGLTIAIILI